MILFFALIVGFNCFVTDRENANQFLRFRRDSNMLGLEEVAKGNFERECLEETCTYQVDR